VVRHLFPACYNDPQVSDLARQVAIEMLGARGVYEPEPHMAGEDFGFMLRAVREAFVWLGVRIEDAPRALHSPTFDIDEGDTR
jgi:amidohydrolase